MALDAATFDELTRRHSRELHLHCYRMLASFDDAQDALQETLLRAWDARDRFEGGAYARAWLYRIATNVCLNVVRSQRRVDSFADISWLQPYPDVLLDEAGGPADQVVQRETVELAFLAALQVLPPRQRAALLARDVLDLTATETARLLHTSVPAATSAVQRARTTLRRHLPDQRALWPSGSPGPAERQLLARFIDAHQRCDTAAALAIAAEDIRVTMPPAPMLFDGVGQAVSLFERAFGPAREGDWRLLASAANRMPAAASYLRRPGDAVFRAFKLDVLLVRDDHITEITTFGYALFPHFGLPDVLTG